MVIGKSLLKSNLLDKESRIYIYILDTEIHYLPNSQLYAYAALVKALFLRGSLHSLSSTFHKDF